MTIKLKGMTWNHPRGYDPMVATSKAWLEKTGVEIAWDKRSLQDFESFPVEQLAKEYDLIVIDHPHVGQITAEKCLAPLDVPGCEAEREEMARNSVGQSYPSYTWQGHQWAFPIDAAAQVMVYRDDLVTDLPTTWDDVIALAKSGRVILPMRPPHSLMTFFTLAANLGNPCATTGPGDLIDALHGETVFERIAELCALIDASNFDMDPIAASEEMAKADSKLAVMPLGYGYVSYALNGFRPRRLSFTDIPAAGGNGPIGSAVGGTGIAVSAFSKNVQAAVDYAYFVAGAETQKTIYAASGGQPGHGIAWDDDAVNAPVLDFYRRTRATLEAGYIRPRHNGYMGFQEAASQRLNTGLLGREKPAAVIADINSLFRSSF